MDKEKNSKSLMSGHMKYDRSSTLGESHQRIQEGTALSDLKHGVFTSSLFIYLSYKIYIIFLQVPFHLVLTTTCEVSKGDMTISLLRPRKLRQRAHTPVSVRDSSLCPFLSSDAILKLHHLFKY